MSERPIDKVIEAIIASLPDDEPGVPELAEGLEAIRKSAAFTAPEAMRIRWDELRSLLWNRLGDPDSDWKNLISEIVVGVVDYRQHLPEATN